MALALLCAMTIPLAGYKFRFTPLLVLALGTQLAYHTLFTVELAAHTTSTQLDARLAAISACHGNWFGTDTAAPFIHKQSALEHFSHGGLAMLLAHVLLAVLVAFLLAGADTLWWSLLRQVHYRMRIAASSAYLLLLLLVRITYQCLLHTGLAQNRTKITQLDGWVEVSLRSRVLGHTPLRWRGPPAAAFI